MDEKYGRIQKALELCDKMHDKDMNSWIVMIGGNEIHRYNKDTLKLFHLMKLHLRTNPNNIIFLLLHVTNPNSMIKSYCIILMMSHYTCIVQPLGLYGDYLE